MSSASNRFWNRPFARNFFLWAALGLLGCGTAFADQSVTLTWSPSPDTNAVGYKIYYGGVSLNYTNSLAVGNTASATISGLSEGATYYFAATTISASGAESAYSNEAIYSIPQSDTNGTPVTATNLPAPTFDALGNLTLNQNAGPQTVVVTNINSGLADGNLNVSVSAATSDATIVTTPTINYTSGNNFASLTLTPVPGATGTTVVTVTVDNGATSNNVTAQTFTVTLLAAPPANPPTFDTLTNLTIYQNAGVQTVVVTNINSGLADGNQNVVVSAATSDATIISVPTVSYTNGNNFAVLTFAPAINAVGTATIFVTVNNGAANNNLASRNFTVTVLPVPVVNLTPTLDPIANVVIPQSAAAPTITLTGIAAGSRTKTPIIRISATSSNSRLVPAPQIRYTSPANTAALTLKPMPNMLGQTIITVTVNDGGKSNNIVRRTFTVAVLPNQPPTLDPIANLAVAGNAAAQTLTLTGITSGSPTENQPLRVTATSSNPRLVPAPVVQYANPANTALLTFKPATNLTGVATITVTVSDGSRNNGVTQKRFTVTVTAAPNNNNTTNANPLAGTNPAASLVGASSVNGCFTFQVAGVAGDKYVVQATSDLVHWSPVQTNTAPFVFQDSSASSFRQRFYRAVQLP